MGKRPFVIIAVFLLLIGGSIRFWSAWQQNQTAVFVITHLSKTTSCAIDEPRLQWVGESPTYAGSPYLQAVIASALETELAPPLLEEWERDPRLYYWFMAQTAVKNEAYPESLSYLTAANAGSQLDDAGHFSATEACSVINWTIASEIGYREPPDGYVQHMMNHRQWTQVADAFERLLMYDLNRADWRIHLAKAYLALEKVMDAERILAPVVANGTLEEQDEAARLLRAITP